MNYSLQTPSANAYSSLSIAGRWSTPASAVFEFRRLDGSVDRFTPEQMKSPPWWHELPNEIALMIEAHLNTEPAKKV
ncbi:hypothetical protein [Roseateles albus]|uniref:Uncharacterized protein n=1 Tax=Roseateles albus TaxID=2987525 RepID=A0ABT5KEH1_9BURK|nr:hypothetical protein [Roseateles albus]MDC8772332.1 hypothetical protein [Roseateles albus]